MSRGVHREMRASASHTAREPQHTVTGVFYFIQFIYLILFDNTYGGTSGDIRSSTRTRFLNISNQ